ncbi:indolethylamine N-methyltransferase-like [Ixodes scapularis]|uniref:indolethylamine N-methyltransferase-like n=1 Tax=Ixodes scapularis TaxID=6945 RepID=UPI001A9E9608|nr:indolethylamine N-methyltransferase-like [Ixodes scapularis]
MPSERIPFRSRPAEMLGSVKSQRARIGFKNTFDARAYVDEVNQRYKPVTVFQQAGLHGIFQSDLVQGKTLLEVGCGPTLWPSFLSSRRFSDIVLSDLMEGNRLELEKWLEKSKDAIDWTSRAEEVAALEGYSDTKKGALEILERTRSSIRKVVHGDVLKPGVLPQEHEEAFDVVLSCNCIESAIADHESFRCAISNVGSLVKPGGLLVLTGMGGVEKFTLGDAEFTVPKLTDDVVKGAVADAGFKVNVYRTENMGAMGQPELFAFVLAARKDFKGDL